MQLLRACKDPRPASWGAAQTARGGPSRQRAAAGREKPGEGRLAGILNFERGSKDSHSSLAVPDPAAVARLGLRGGEWACAGPPGPGRRAEGAPRVSGREEERVSGWAGDAGGRGPRPAPSVADPARRPKSRPPRPGSFLR